MGNELLKRVTAALRDAGVRAEAALPGQKLPAITGPVAAVSLRYADWTKKSATVLVEIRSPAALGGDVCQSVGMQVGDVLAAMGAACRQESCRFDGNAGHFCAELQGVFAQQEEMPEQEPGTEPEPEVPSFRLFMNGQMLTNVVAFTTEQIWDKESGSLTPRWAFRLEEFLPEDGGCGVEPEENFALSISRNGTLEQYSRCSWTGCKRTVESKGYTLIREGISEARFV